MARVTQGLKYRFVVHSFPVNEMNEADDPTINDMLDNYAVEFPSKIEALARDYAGREWQVVSHSLTFVPGRLVLTLLIRHPVA